MEEKFKEIIESYRIDAPSVEDVIYAVGDMLWAMAERTKEEEPEAWKSIEEYENTARIVNELPWFL